jgi:hypothetical protein
VVGDSDAVDAELLASADDFIQRCVTIHGVAGVDVEVGFKQGAVSLSINISFLWRP